MLPPSRRRPKPRSVIDIHLPTDAPLTAEQKQSRIAEAGFMPPKEMYKLFEVDRDRDIEKALVQHEGEELDRLIEAEAKSKSSKDKSRAIIKQNNDDVIAGRTRLEKANRLPRNSREAQEQLIAERKIQQEAENAQREVDNKKNEARIKNDFDGINKRRDNIQKAHERAVVLAKKHKEDRIKKKEEESRAGQQRWNDYLDVVDSGQEPDIGDVFEDEEAHFDSVREERLAPLYERKKNGEKILKPLENYNIDIEKGYTSSGKYNAHIKKTMTVFNELLNKDSSILPAGRSNPNLHIPVQEHVLKKDVAQIINRVLNVTQKSEANVRMEVLRMRRAGRLDKKAHAAIINEIKYKFKKGEPLLHNGKVNPIYRERLFKLLNIVDVRNVEHRRIFNAVGRVAKGGLGGKVSKPPSFKGSFSKSARSARNTLIEERLIDPSSIEDD
jgi:hypothetical protein